MPECFIHFNLCNSSVLDILLFLFPTTKSEFDYAPNHTIYFIYYALLINICISMRMNYPFYLGVIVDKLMNGKINTIIIRLLMICDDFPRFMFIWLMKIWMRWITEKIN